MKILLLGNYVNNSQQSMQRFAEQMLDGLSAAGHGVRLAKPPVLFGRLHRSETGLGKWIGYIDRFLLYPLMLSMQSRWADVVHICDQANAVYIPFLIGKAHVVTCHDMLAISAARGEIAESPTGLTGQIYQRWILWSLRRAQKIVSVSIKTKEEVLRLTGLCSERLTVVPNALNYPYHPMGVRESKDCLKALGMLDRTPFFLHVGSNAWYKNRIGVLRIFSELLKYSCFEAHQLVMAGKPLTAEMKQLSHDLEIHQHVVELGPISNKNLCALYSTAEALLFPSMAEGFGWPIIEAQACRCEVITTSRPPMTVVSGGAAVFIDPANLEESASKIVSARTQRQELVRSGLLNAKRHDLPNMIEGYIKAYKSVVKDRSARDRYQNV